MISLTEAYREYILFRNHNTYVCPSVSILAYGFLTIMSSTKSLNVQTNSYVRTLECFLKVVVVVVVVVVFSFLREVF